MADALEVLYANNNYTQEQAEALAQDLLDAGYRVKVGTVTQKSPDLAYLGLQIVFEMGLREVLAYLINEKIRPVLESTVFKPKNTDKEPTLILGEEHYPSSITVKDMEALQTAVHLFEQLERLMMESDLFSGEINVRYHVRYQSGQWFIIDNESLETWRFDLDSRRFIHE